MPLHVQPSPDFGLAASEWPICAAVVVARQLNEAPGQIDDAISLAVAC
ncbi:hypothetical protein BHAOGJBA_6047 [Methylobacterium hispanicum]|uniref:Uncharacterized protein n=1 Tax=Methylobacterium hispanicum TaxID=270350 RepID=A0AAV4ZXW2_9HYPH|nr:hypothetical protein BHAOGJBA_6047 [Methylobacterium hispanicum]